MPNMSYVLFQNTLRDLRDCYDALFDECSPEEEKAKLQLVEVCRMIWVEMKDELPEKGD